MTAPIPLAEQLAEIEREIAQRIQLYPERIASGALSQADADERLPRICAVRNTLLWLQRNETRIKDALRGQGK